MAIGKNNDAPAIYSVVSSIKRLLDHLKEAAFYSSKDLESMTRKIQELHGALQRCQAEYDPELLELIARRMAVCESTIAYLQAVISHLTPELAEVWEKLVSILRRLSNLNTRSRYSKEEHAGIKKEIDDIEKMCPALHKDLPESIARRYTEIMQDQIEALNAPPEKLVNDLFERCVLWSSIIENNPLYVDDNFKDLYNRLKTIRDNLESRSLLQAWSLRETDLYDYQRRLDRIDEERTLDGNFVNAEGKQACVQTQRTLLYFLRKSYALIYLMLTHSEPVSEALLPIYNQLKTLKKCLREVQKAGGVSSPRELYPYSMKVSDVHCNTLLSPQHTDFGI
jgi:DNA repair ATPase RecN